MLLVVTTASACTTRTELVEGPRPSTTPMTERYPLAAPSLLVGPQAREVAGWGVGFDGVVVREAGPGSLGDATVRPYTPSGNVSWAHGRVIGGDEPRLLTTLSAVTEPPEHGVRRWVPPAIGFLAGPPERSARSPLTDADPFAPWRLDRGVRELAAGTAENAYGEKRLSLCLVGRDAAIVWRHLFTGVNTAYLRVDDGRRWELQSSVVPPPTSAAGARAPPVSR